MQMIACTAGGQCYDQWTGLGLHPNVDHAGPNIPDFVLTDEGFEPWMQMQSSFLDYPGMIFNPWAMNNAFPQGPQTGPAPVPATGKPTLDCNTWKCTDGSEPKVSDPVRLALNCLVYKNSPKDMEYLCDGKPLGAPTDDQGNIHSDGPGTVGAGGVSPFGVDPLGLGGVFGIDQNAILKKIAYIAVALILIYLGAKAVTE